MSANLLAKLSMVPRRLPVVCRLSKRTAASTGGGGGDKASKEPKKPFEQPKTSGATTASKPPPPPAKEPFDNSKYQAGELFEYTTMSFYDIECDMSAKRCPVPSSVKQSA
eukprot:TRINITY_DN34769_c0_g1_i1.p1 TRINITY_DN34769_c0_g1~~TRINITY_DN34769_c0_g1_i1.p1  ORF type:complete len:123 (-),score=26.00 TRINITY_DN34769_c0_g1_i1:144-473(-)